MATIELAETCGEGAGPRPSLSVPGLLRTYVQWRRKRRLLARLPRLSEHLMRDIGLDPDEVYDAVPCRWDEVHPGHHRVR